MMTTTKAIRRPRLATKFNILTILLILVTSFGIAFFVIRDEMSHTYRELVNHGASIAAMVSQNTEYGIYTEDPESLMQVVESLTANPDIAYVYILNREKNVLAYKINISNVDMPREVQYKNFEKYNHIRYGEFVNKRDGHSYIDVLAPVVSAVEVEPAGILLDARDEKQRKVIGYIHLGMTQENLRKRIDYFLLSTLLFTAVIVMFGAIFTLFMTKKITSPVKELALIAQEISQGKLDHTIEIEGKDEISDLARAFDHMLKNLRTYRQEVEDRTGELAGANQQMMQEIIERKRAEENLASEKERLSVTLRSIGDGVITADKTGKVFLVNKVAEELTGWTHNTAYGKPIHEVFHILHGDTRKPCASPAETVLETGSIVELSNQKVLLAKNQTEKYVAVSGAPIRDQKSEIIGVILVFRDITEKKKMEEELFRSRKIESIGVLAGGIAHDFNNLLTAILGNINLAKLYVKTEDSVYGVLEEAEKASLRASDLTQQLLTFSKGGAPIKNDTSIVGILRDSASFALLGSNVKCKFSIPEDLWHVEADAGQVSQVFNNLIINADHAMPEGGTVTLTAGNTTVKPNQDLQLEYGKYVKISIQDQGVGIPDEHLTKIFDPYFTTKQKGSGLGLATAYSIIEKHDGFIRAISKIGVGTTFDIYIPASSQEATSQKGTEERLLNGGGKILVMDDEEVIRCVAERILVRLGYEVALAKDGAEAIEAYQKAKDAGELFDAVIMDLTIPGGMGGREAVQRLLEIDPKVKVIVSSGFSNDPVMADFRKYGFCGIISKPYMIADVSRALQEVLNGEG